MTPVPNGPFSAVLADPPWSFSTWSTRGKGRADARHYSVMSLAEMKALPVADVAARDSVLFLWTTDPMLPRALDLIAAWGFTYKTVGFYWMKTTRKAEISATAAIEIEGNGLWPIGCGYWTRANPELCLLGTRGHPKRLHADVRKLIVAPRREHSRKPDEVHGPLTQYFGTDDMPAEDPGETVAHIAGSYSVKVWQRYAEPVWMDISQGDVLSRKLARAEDDERHIAPLQLTVIRRCYQLWTNPGDTVLSPFAGIGSEGYVAVEMGRRFVGIELKDTYYSQAVANMETAERSMLTGTLLRYAEPRHSGQ